MDAERGTHRAEGFSDAFFAIVITLLVLDLRIPEAMEEMPLHLALGLYAIGFVLSWFLPIVGIALMLALAVFFAVADRISGFASEDIAND